MKVISVFLVAALFAAVNAQSCGRKPVKIDWVKAHRVKLAGDLTKYLIGNGIPEEEVKGKSYFELIDMAIADTVKCLDFWRKEGDTEQIEIVEKSVEYFNDLKKRYAR